MMKNAERIFTLAELVSYNSLIVTQCAVAVAAGLPSAHKRRPFPARDQFVDHVVQLRSTLSELEDELLKKEGV